MTCLCWEEGDFFWGGALVVCSCEELRWGRRRRNRGETSRYMTFADGFTDELFRLWFRRLIWRQTGYITVRSCRFESLGDSVSIFIGESVTSPYGADVLNPSVIPSALSSVNWSRHRMKLMFWIPRWFCR